ncbi:AraC family transcriptional regulator [Dokdonia sp.]|uniref:AraC family transcriptional regulator n=1 Tax=Dokdonia sp. TaxID=2024995 RepID=UPI003266307A
MYYKTYTSIFIFFALVTHTYGQQHHKGDTVPVVSDKVKMFITTSDSIKKIKDLFKRTERLDKDTLLTMEYYKLFLDRGTRTKAPRIQYYSGSRLGGYYNKIADYERAFKYSAISLKASIEAKDSSYMIRSHVLLGNVYFQLGIYDKSLKLYQEAKELAQKTDDQSSELVCLSNIANIRVKLGRNEDALKAYNTTLSLLGKEDLSNIHTRLSTLLGKGKSLVDLGFYDQGLITYEEGIRLAKKYDLTIYNGEFYLNIGNLYYKKAQYQLAIDYLQRAKQLLSEHYNDTYNNILITNYYLAQCFYVTQHYDEAMELLQHNFGVIGANYKTDKIVEMYDLGIKIAEIQEDTDQQLIFLNQNKLLSKLKLENQTKTRDLLFDSDVKTLKDHNKLLDIEKEKQELKKKIAACIALVMLLLLLITWIRYKHKIKTNERKFQAIITDLKEVKTPVPVVSNDKNEDTQVKDDRALGIIERLTVLEKTNFFIAQDCNLYNTAKQIDTNTTYLSKTLNTYKKQSFNQYLNELRIRYILIQLKENTRFRAYTLKAISAEVGYKSINTFTKAFKTHTGLTPSYYIKQLESKMFT